MASSLRLLERCCQSVALSCKAEAVRGATASRLVCLHSPALSAPRRSLLASKRSVPKWALVPQRSKHWVRRDGSKFSRATFSQLAVATESPPSEEHSEAKGESVLLDVSGMMCGGCAASVRRTLANDPRVAHAAVNLLTGTAAIQLCPGLSEETGGALAAVLTKSGFPTGLRNSDASSHRSDMLSQQRQDSLRDTTVQLVVAWSLVAVCLSHHAGHLLHGLGFHQIAHGAPRNPQGALLSPLFKEHFM